MRISFDFDGVLSTPRFQEQARRLARQHQVYVITQRNPTHLVMTIAAYCGIPAGNVYFTRMQDKWPWVRDLRIEAHFDDDPRQIALIRQRVNGCQAIQV